MNIIFLCIKIFFVRIIDVTLGTIRTVYTVKDKILASAVIGFFEVLVWFLIAAEALETTDNILIPIFYSLGFATGTYIGGYISRKMINGNLHLEIITQKGSKQWLNELRENGFAVSVININKRGNENDKYMFLMEIESKDLNKVYNIIKKHDKNAFVIVNESKEVVNGYFKVK